ncbi:MAG: SpoIIE family protein phosphatase, partial [Selenomonadaceae bacterium]|nr:SpoIIE family protein phosphatase [Selenomonadaceae bacterium]
IILDEVSGLKFNEDGSVQTFPVTKRPWYTGAIEKGGVFFSDVEEDTFSDNIGIVCSIPVYSKGKLIAVVGADLFVNSMSDYIESTAQEGMFSCIINSEGHVVFAPKSQDIFSVSANDVDMRLSEEKGLAAFIGDAIDGSASVQIVNVGGKDYYMVAAGIEEIGWTLVSVVDKAITDSPANIMIEQFGIITSEASEVFENGLSRSRATIFVILGILFVLGTISALILASRIVNPLAKMTKRITEISEDKLLFEMEDSFRTKDEIEILAENFAALSGKTVRYLQEVERVTAEKERIGTELALATRIQADMLPNIFPPFPERSEFDIYASMDPAKEVGGDFYDFFLVDEDHLCMVIADVSGKGVPAALFMMASKIILASQAKQGKSPAQILTDSNASICSNNREQMFVTVWLGILEISTGRLTAANAGHEFPAIRRPDGSFELYRDKHGLVIGGMDGIRYKEYELQMEPGAKLFLYTDGVPEATNAEMELYGTDRMIDALNEDPMAAPEQILQNVRTAVDAFVQEAEQFDDLTMLCIEYKGPAQPLNS